MILAEMGRIEALKRRERKKYSVVFEIRIEWNIKIRGERNIVMYQNQEEKKKTECKCVSFVPLIA